MEFTACLTQMALDTPPCCFPWMRAPALESRSHGSCVTLGTLVCLGLFSHLGSMGYCIVAIENVCGWLAHFLEIRPNRLFSQIKFSNLLLWNKQEIITGLWVKSYSCNSWGFFLPGALMVDTATGIASIWWLVVKVAVIKCCLGFTSGFHDSSGAVEEEGKKYFPLPRERGTIPFQTLLWVPFVVVA